MSDFSEIEEMYLKTMFEIHSDNPAAIVKTTQLADIKGVSAASTLLGQVLRLVNRPFSGKGEFWAAESL